MAQITLTTKDSEIPFLKEVFGDDIRVGVIKFIKEKCLEYQNHKDVAQINTQIPNDIVS